MVYRLRINPKPAHFFGKAVVVISRIDHNSRIAFAVEEDVRHPFAHAGNILVDPAGVQRLEDFLAPVHPAHCFSLKLRCFFRHDYTSFLCCDAQPALFIFVALNLTKSCLFQIRFQRSIREMVIPLMICVHLSSFAVSPFASLQMKKVPPGFSTR